MRTATQRLGLTAAVLAGLIALTGAAQAGVIEVTAPPPGADALGRIQAGLARANPGDRVVLRAGDYRVSKAVRFPRAGVPGRVITLMAAPGEYVALLGSVRLTGWRKHEGNVWKVEHPPKLIKGLYEDTERLTHARPNWGKRENPPVSELKAPGTWTQDKQWVYLWSRESDTPDNHRIEASQRYVMVVDKSWIRVEGLRMFFGQNVVCVIHADNSEVVRCEIAHCSNSVDNSYNAYFSGCSNSAFRECVIHDSFYWGDHGSNSHVLSSINCGDKGPNFVDRCEIFNGGLGVGTKGAARELVIKGSRIYDVVNGIVISGERSSGPGAGKKDRGHYVVYGNRISDCSKGIWFGSGDTQNNRVWNNLIERCGAGVSMRNYKGEPKRSHVANNVFLECGQGVYAVGGRKGQETLGKFVKAGLKSHNNLYFKNRIDWRNPLTWGRNLDMPVAKLAARADWGLGKRAVSLKPLLDKFGRSKEGCPTIDHGAELELPGYIEKPKKWHIGLGPWGEDEKRPDPGLTLSIAGSPSAAGGAVAAGQTLGLKAVLENESPEKGYEIAKGRDAVVTYHFRYVAGHFDKQELYRVRVELPEKTLKPGEKLDLAKLPGWKAPVNGKLGDAFHLRVDTKQWKSGMRLRATLRLIDRKDDLAKRLQRLEPLVRSKEVLRMSLK